MSRFWAIVSPMAPVLLCLFLLVLSASALAKTVTTEPSCKAQMSLLDPVLKNVLDDLINLQVDLRSQDPSSGLSLKMMDLYNKKIGELGSLVSDDAIRKSISEYIVTRVAAASEVADKKKNKKLKRERDQRELEKEEFVFFDANGINSSKASDARTLLTPGGFFIHDDEERANVIISDIENKISKKIPLSSQELGPGEELETIRYSPQSDEIFVSFFLFRMQRIVSAKVSELLKTDGAYIYKQKPIFDITGDNFNKIHEALKEANPDTTFKGLLATFQDYSYAFSDFEVSGDGRFVAALYENFGKGGPFFSNILVYDTALDSFKAFKLILDAEPFQDRTFNYQWALSPDGKFIAAQETGHIVIFDTLTGERLNTFRAKASQVKISHNSKWVAVDNGRGQIRVFDPYSASDDRYIKLSSKRKPLGENAFYRYDFSPDDTEIFMSTGSDLRRWSLKNRRMRIFRNVGTRRIEFTSDMKTMMTIDHVNKATFFNIRTK